MDNIDEDLKNYQEMEAILNSQKQQEENGEDFLVKNMIDIQNSIEDEETDIFLNKEGIIEEEEKEEEDDDDFLKQEEENDEEEDNSEEEYQYSEKEILYKTAYDLGEKFDIELPNLEEEDIDYNELFSVLSEKIEEKIEGHTYKTAEARLLDEFIVNGGDITNFVEFYHNDIDEFNKMLSEVESLSPEELVLADSLNKGFSEEEALAYIEILESKGQLEAKANFILEDSREAIRELKNNKTREFLDNKVKEIEQAKRESFEEIEKEKENLANLLDNINDVFTYPITEKDKEEIFDFITITDNEGKTQLDYFLQSNENLIFSAFLAKKGNSFFKYLQSKAKEEGKKNIFNKLAKDPIVNKKSERVISNINKLNDF